MTERDPVMEPATHRPWWKIRVPLGPLAIAYVLIIVVAAVGFQLISNQSAERDQARCEDTRDNRIVLRQLVELSTSSGGGYDLTKVPGYDQLDPATQTYMANLGQASTPSTVAGEEPTASPFVTRALELLTLPDCGGEGALEDLLQAARLQTATTTAPGGTP